jgi:hypothetical protein
MPLENLRTDLRSLKYGNDQPGDGSSKQPYIQTPIGGKGVRLNPFSDTEYLKNVPDTPDFLLRGGLKAPLAAAEDVERLTRYFSDFDSPKGFLFTTKQNLLSRVSVATEASGRGLNWKRTPLNSGVYTPVSTLAAAASSYLGTFPYKQGLSPLSGIRTYSDISKGTGEFPNSIKFPERNRLVQLTETKINPQTLTQELFSYSGGPQSYLGAGQTTINLVPSEGRTGRNNVNLNNIGFFNEDPLTLPTSALDALGVAPLQSTLVPASRTPNANKLSGFNAFTKPIIELDPFGLVEGNFNTVSTKYSKQVGGYFSKDVENINTGISPNRGEQVIENTTVFPEKNIQGQLFTQKEGNRIYDNGTVVSTYNELLAAASGSNNSPTAIQTYEIKDFRVPLLDNKKSEFIMGTSLDYNKAKNRIEGNAESRINMITPGQRGNRKNYQKGKIINGGNISVVDRINFQPIYQSSAVRQDKEIAKNDLVKFRIAALDKTSPNLKQFIHFRAFINSFSDAYTGEWSGQKFMGRGEQFYKYGGFNRSIAMSFTVAAQSKPELMAQYKKLNFLASNTAPTYSTKGYMGGPLVQLTMGGWCYELPGFFTSVNLEIPTDTTWEIAIGTDTEPGRGDSTVKEMPHRVNCSLNFTPIHTFRPEKQENTYTGIKNEVAKYGEQQYIELTNGINDNYVPVSLADAQQGIGGGPDKQQFK